MKNICTLFKYTLGINHLIIFVNLGKTIETMSVAMAATKIQNLWKGAIARRQVKKQREEELAFIGMVKDLSRIFIVAT